MKVLRWLDKNLELTISSVFLVGMVVAVCMQVLSRYVFPSPISWTEEATRYLFVWMVFTSLGICAKRGKHIRITIVQAKMPKAIPYMNVFADLFFVLVAALCAWYGVGIVTTIKEAGQTSSAMSWLYKWQVYLIVPIGFAATLFRLAQDMIENIKTIMKKGNSEGKEEQNG